MSSSKFDIHEEILKLNDSEVPYYVPNVFNVESEDEAAVDDKIDCINYYFYYFYSLKYKLLILIVLIQFFLKKQ